MKIWILCPNLRGARLFQFERFNSEIKYMREFPRPLPLPRDADFPEDFDPDVDAKHTDLKYQEVIGRGFSRFLIKELDNYLKQGAFDGLILCAENHLLEILTTRLTDSLKKVVRGQVKLDLYDVNETDLMAYVKDILSPSPEVVKPAADAAVNQRHHGRAAAS